jgi:hypothetical protein
MKLSKLIKVLQNAKKELGDVPVMVMDEEMGSWEYLSEVLKLHPYTGPYGCMDRTKPADSIGLVRNKGFSSKDLLLGQKD